MIRAVIFDFFGVLTQDPTHALSLAVSDAAAKEKVDLITYANDLGKLSDAELIKQLAKVSGQTEAEVRHLFYGSPRLSPDILALIKRLRAHYRVGLLSNAGPTSLDPYWSQAEMDEHFDVVVLSSEVGRVKPDPVIYQVICERLGVRAEEAVFIDDVPRFVKGAEAVGMTGIVFTSPAQTEQRLARILGKKV